MTPLWFDGLPHHVTRVCWSIGVDSVDQLRAAIRDRKIYPRCEARYGRKTHQLVLRWLNSKK